MSFDFSDLIGLNPTGIEGRHFRRNITSWYCLWDSISDLYPEASTFIGTSVCFDTKKLSDI